MTAPLDIVLVPGAWHAATCWDAVGAILRAAGQRHRAVDLPSNGAEEVSLGGLGDDVIAVTDAVEASGRSVLLVGHSYGATVAAAATHEGVAGLVLVAGLMADIGESATTLILQGRTPAFAEAVAVGQDSLEFARDAAREVLYQDAPPAVAAEAASRLVRQSARSVRTRLDTAAWHSKPSAYVVCTRDRAIKPEFQRQLARRASRSIALDSGHSPMLSRPNELARLLAELADDAQFLATSTRATAHDDLERNRLI